MADGAAGEARRKQQKPELTTEEAARLALEHFGVRVDAHAQVTQLDSYEDANFRLRDAHAPGHDLTLKVHNGVDTSTPALIEAQDAAIRAVRAHGIWAPHAQPTLDGRAMATVELQNGRGERHTHAIRLLEFRRARLHAQLEPTVEVCAALGSVIARVDLALATVCTPTQAAAQRTSAWDLRNFREAALPTARAHAAEAELPLIDAAASWYDEGVVPVAGRLRAQVIHADLNDNNLLVSEGRSAEPRAGAVGAPAADAEAAVTAAPAGVIDFGDLMWSWRVCDLAVALAYVLIQCHYETNVERGSPARAWACCAAMAAGYETHAPLDAAEWRALPGLIAARVITALGVGTCSAAQEPANAYLRLALEPCQRVLRLLAAARSAEEVERCLRGQAR